MVEKLLIQQVLIPELYIQNFEKSIAFYTDILGFKILYSRDEEKFVMLEREGAQIMFEQIGIGSNCITDKLKPPFGRGVNFQIQVSDINALYNMITQSGVKLFLDMEDKWYRVDSDYVGNRQFIIQDPDGYLLRFFQRINL